MHPIINHLHETHPRWFAVHTRSKSEKFVQRILAKKGIRAYVPLQKLMRRYTRSTRVVEMPLIHGYVFVHITKGAYLPILETENVVGFVKSNKALRAIPEPEIELLRRITLEDGLDLSVVPGRFGEGESVEITAGNLIGMKGQIIREESARKFQIELFNLGFSLLITVDAAFLGKIGKDLA